MKNKIIEIKNTLDGTNSRLDEAENQVRYLKEKVVENIQSEQPKEFLKMIV